MYYPVHIDLTDQNITIIGGGIIALRKCQFFIENKIPITVIAKTFNKAFLATTAPMTLIEDAYKPAYIKESHLVIVATNDPQLNAEIGHDCREKKKWVNVASDAKLSNFIIPGVIQRGDLLISVSTSGKNPRISKEIKETLSEQFGEEYEMIVATTPRNKVKKDDRSWK